MDKRSYRIIGLAVVVAAVVGAVVVVVRDAFRPVAAPVPAVAPGPGVPVLQFDPAPGFVDAAARLDKLLENKPADSADTTDGTGLTFDVTAMDAHGTIMAEYRRRAQQDGAGAVKWLDSESRRPTADLVRDWAGNPATAAP